jgi:hypothetical protein
LTTTNSSPKTSKFAKALRWIIGGGLAALAIVIVVAMLSGALSNLPNGDSARADIDNAIDIPEDCSVAHFALNPNNPTVSNPDKESTNAMGPRVFPDGYVVKKADIKKALTEYDERRECGDDDMYDTMVTASVYADWSAQGLTKRKVAYADIKAFVAELNADSKLYASVVGELKAIEAASVVSIEEVPANTWSIYVLADGKGGLTAHIGRSLNVGTALVFTHGDAVVKLRLECGFQILHTTPPPGLPQCEEADCLTPKSSDPKDYVYPDAKKPVSVGEPGTDKAPAVETEQEGGGGVVDTPTNDPGSETGVQAPGTNTGTTDPTNPPTNQGGDNGPGDTGGF